MDLGLTILIFVTVALVVFSFLAAMYAPKSLLGPRLRALGWQKKGPVENTAIK